MRRHIVAKTDYRLLAAAIIVIAGSVILLRASGVLALGGKYFYDANTAGCDLGESGYSGGNYASESCGDKPGVRLTVGEDDLVPQSYVVLQASANSATRPTGGTITINGMDLCPGDGAENNRDRIYAGYYYDNRNNANALPGGTAVTNYVIGTHAVNGVYRANLANCGRPNAGDATDNLTIDLNSNDYQPLVNNGVTVPNVWVVSITISHINLHSGNDGIKNGFTLTSTGGLTIATKAGGGGLCTADDGKCTTVQTASGDSGDRAKYMTYIFRFGSDCTVPPEGLNTKLSFYDLDFGSGDTVIKVTIKDTAPDGTVRWMLRPGVPTNWQAARPSYTDSFQPARVNAGTTRVTFTAYPEHKYIAYVENVGPHLVMQVGTPFDGVFYDHTCPVPLLTPTVSLSPSGDFEVGDTITASAKVNNTGAPGSANWDRLLWYDNGNDAYENESVDHIISRSPASGTTTFNAGDTPFADWSEKVISTYPRICTSLYLHDGNPSTTKFVPPDGHAPIQCRNILRRPYFQVINGDADASASLPNCTTNTTSTISAYNRGDSPNFRGSGASIAAFAAGAITEFTSGVKPNGLSFANTLGGAYAAYGGGFQSTYCVPDYWSNPPNTGNKDITASDGTYVTNGDIYVTGDSPASAGFGLNNIPLRWIVANNIYIDRNATNIDGNYIAKNNIYTCAYSNQNPVPVTSMASDCATRLVVNGSFAAGSSIKLQRTYGSLNDTGPTSSPADTTSMIYSSGPLGLCPGGKTRLQLIEHADLAGSWGDNYLCIPSTDVTAMGGIQWTENVNDPSSAPPWGTVGMTVNSSNCAFMTSGNVGDNSIFTWFDNAICSNTPYGLEFSTVPVDGKKCARIVEGADGHNGFWWLTGLWFCYGNPPAPVLAGHGAEQINYSPEIWMQAIRPNGSMPGGSSSGSGKYDSITLLPPVL